MQKAKELRAPVEKVDQKKLIKDEDQKVTYEKVKDILLKPENGSLQIEPEETSLHNLSIRLGGLGFVTDNENFQDNYFQKTLHDLILPTLRLKRNPTELFSLLEDLCIHIV